MAATTPIFFNGVKETTATTGTGTWTLAGAVTGFNAFSLVGNKGLCSYRATDGTNFEEGVGTYTVSGTTLSRDLVISSSNAGALVSFPGPTTTIILTPLASQLGPLIVPPGPSSGWTWVNQGTATVADGLNGAMAISVPTGGVNWRFMVKTLPATPYRVIAKISFWQQNVNSMTAGLYVYDGTKVMGIELLTQAGPVFAIRVQKMATVTTDSGAAATYTILPPKWFRFLNDGVNFTFDISQDGTIWYQVYSEAVGTFITPTKAGFGGLNASGAIGNTPTLESWTVLSY